MFKFIKKGKNFKITAICENDNLQISFNECFKINKKIKLPNSFVIKDNLIFKDEKYKLNISNNILISLILKGKVNFLHLKSFLPTVFNNLKIKRENEKNFIKKNKEMIIEIGSEIIENEILINLINKKLN